MTAKKYARGINFGNTSDVDDVNGGKTPAFFPSPSNYTPTPVSTELAIMISAHLKGIDDKLGELAELSASTAGFADQFETSTGSSSDYSISNSFDFATKMDVFFNGHLQAELIDWQRTVSTTNRKIETADAGTPFNLPAGVIVRTRIYDFNFVFTDKLFTTDGSTTAFDPTIPFTTTTKIDVFLNGSLLKENEDWERSEGSPLITTISAPATPFAFLTNSTDNLRIRVHKRDLVDEHFSGNVASVVASQAFEDDTNIDVYFNGILKQETEDWTRTSGSNTINIVGGASTTASDTDIRVRIWP